MSLDTWKQLASQTINNWLQKLTPVLVNLKNESIKLISRIRSHRAVNLIGIDIATDSLKLAKITSYDDKTTLDHFAILPMPAGAFIKDEIKEPAIITSLLQDIIKLANIDTKEVALAITRSSAIIKNIQIDSRLAPEEIESRAWIEANRLFPDLVGSIYLDFSVSKPLATDETKREMTLVACRKDVINPYLDILQQAGLKASVIDINCYALQRALPLTLPPDENITTLALLHVNLNQSTLLVIHDDVLIYAHDQTYDGARLKNLVESYLKTRENPGVLPLADDDAYMTVLTENISSHLRHTMHFFFSNRPNINIQKIILAGDCADINHLNTLIQRETGIETSIGNPLLNLKIGPHVDEIELKKHQTSLMQCFGLAMTSFGGGH